MLPLCCFLLRVRVAECPRQMRKTRGSWPCLGFIWTVPPLRQTPTNDRPNIRPSYHPGTKTCYQPKLNSFVENQTYCVCSLQQQRKAQPQLAKQDLFSVAQSNESEAGVERRFQASLALPGHTTDVLLVLILEFPLFFTTTSSSIYQEPSHTFEHTEHACLPA